MWLVTCHYLVLYRAAAQLVTLNQWWFKVNVPCYLRAAALAGTQHARDIHLMLFRANIETAPGECLVLCWVVTASSAAVTVVSDPETWDSDQGPCSGSDPLPYTVILTLQVHQPNTPATLGNNTMYIIQNRSLCSYEFAWLSKNVWFMEKYL